MATMSPCEIMAVSLGFFLFVYFGLVEFSQRTFLRHYPKAVIVEVSNKVVSALQAIGAFCCGIIIALNCWHDIYKAQHFLANGYAWVLLVYCFHDIGSMFHVYYHRNFDDLKHKSISQCWSAFCSARTLMIVHHLWIALFAFPCIIWLRHGKGDFFLGCFYLAEFSTPFVSLRAVLSELGLKTSRLYVVNGIFMIVAFFFCRILLFVFMYWCWGQHENVPVWRVPAIIPFGCNVCCAICIAPQLYWWFLMIKGARNALTEQRRSGQSQANVLRPQTHQPVPSAGLNNGHFATPKNFAVSNGNTAKLD